jgi:hypothetical protein
MPTDINDIKLLLDIPNIHKIFQYFPFQGPPKYTQIGIFGTKINYLATLARTHSTSIAVFSLGTRVVIVTRLGLFLAKMAFFLKANIGIYLCLKKQDFYSKYLQLVC